MASEKNIFGATSADNIKTMIETLLQRNEYIDANDRRHNSFSASLNKFAQFADISKAYSFMGTVYFTEKLYLLTAIISFLMDYKS